LACGNLFAATTAMLLLEYIAALQSENLRFRGSIRGELACWDAKIADNSGERREQGRGYLDSLVKKRSDIGDSL